MRGLARYYDEVGTLKPSFIVELIEPRLISRYPVVVAAVLVNLDVYKRQELTFADVDYSNKLLRFEQNKTKGHSTKSGVVIPLNDSLLKLIGMPANSNSKDDLIFPLPS